MLLACCSMCHVRASRSLLLLRSWRAGCNNKAGQHRVLVRLWLPLLAQSAELAHHRDGNAVRKAVVRGRC